MAAKVDAVNAKVAWQENKPSYDENIGSLWTDFTQNTGFHGLNKLTPGRNYKLRCFLWTLAVVCMTAYMSYTVAKELMNYYRYPTVTSMKVELVEELPFPAVTVCNQSPLNMSKLRSIDPELESYFIRTSMLGYLKGPINWETQYLSSTFREGKGFDWWKSMLMDPESMYYQCFMTGVPYMPCTKVMKPVMTNYGLCGTFNFNTSDVRSVRIAGSENNFILFAGIYHDEYVTGSQLSAGLRVILHEPHVHPDAATSSFLTAPGTTTYAVVKASTFKYLPSPYKAFANTTCIDTTAPDFNNTLEFFDTYTYEHCLLECEIRKVHEICGCSKAQDDDSLEPKCSIQSLNKCYFPTFGKVRLDVESRKLCGCEMPCSFQMYEAKVSSSRYPSNVFVDQILELGYAPNATYIRDNFLEIRVYYETLMVQSVEQLAQYNTETLIGNLGGQMGICLGASILTLTELGEFILIVCMTFIRRVTHKTEIKR